MHESELIRALEDWSLWRTRENYAIKDKLVQDAEECRLHQQQALTKIRQIIIGQWEAVV